MFDKIPGTVQAIAGSVLGLVGLAVLWVRGSPARKEKKFRQKLAEIDSAMQKAKLDHDETKYNDLLADRKRLLDSWVR